MLNYVVTSRRRRRDTSIIYCNNIKSNASVYNIFKSDTSLLIQVFSTTLVYTTIIIVIILCAIGFGGLIQRLSMQDNAATISNDRSSRAGVHSYGSSARIITAEEAWGVGWFREFNSIMIIEKPIGAAAAAASAVTNKTNFRVIYRHTRPLSSRTLLAAVHPVCDYFFSHLCPSPPRVRQPPPARGVVFLFFSSRPLLDLTPR